MKPIIGINMSYEQYKDENPDGVLFRDFYKSYVAYVDTVQKYGGMVLNIPPFDDLRELDCYINQADGFIFTGGDDYPPEYYKEGKHPKTKLLHPRRAKADLYLAKKVLQTHKPVLAICGGIQLVNIVRGGKLIQHLEHLETHNKKNKTRDSAHLIHIKKDSLLYDIYKNDELMVNSAHHQAVHPDYIGEGLQVVATAPDGVIEALELEIPHSRFFIAVQWHPERVYDEEQKALIFKAFLGAVKPSSP
jgi:putative glutamine amidotransferase